MPSCKINLFDKISCTDEEQQPVRFMSILEANNAGALDTTFCIYEMPIGSIIEHNGFNYILLGYAKQTNNMICRETSSSEIVALDSSENAKYSLANYNYFLNAHDTVSYNTCSLL